MDDDIRFLLMQVRDDTDPMRQQEVRCFARVLQCEPSAIAVHDLISGRPDAEALERADVVLLGGSGDYSVVSGGRWLPEALAAMRELVDRGQPTFASCWGFQALSLALGGEVVTDVSRAEIGTHRLQRTNAAGDDSVFSALPDQFLAQMGHQDIVVRLPANAVLLASSSTVENQAFGIRGKPIYGTQFHPELDRAAIIERLWAYPQYVEKAVGVPMDQFVETCQETPESNDLLPRFVRWAMNNR